MASTSALVAVAAGSSLPSRCAAAASSRPFQRGWHTEGGKERRSSSHPANDAPQPPGHGQQEAGFASCLREHFAKILARPPRVYVVLSSASQCEVFGATERETASGNEGEYPHGTPTVGRGEQLARANGGGEQVGVRDSQATVTLSSAHEAQGIAVATAAMCPPGGLPCRGYSHAQVEADFEKLLAIRAEQVAMGLSTMQGVKPPVARAEHPGQRNAVQCGGRDASQEFHDSCKSSSVESKYGPALESEPSGTMRGRDPKRRQHESNPYFGYAVAKLVANGVSSEPLDEVSKGLIDGVPIDEWQRAAAERQSLESPVGRQQRWPTTARRSPGRAEQCSDAGDGGFLWS